MVFLLQYALQHKTTVQTIHNKTVSKSLHNKFKYINIQMHNPKIHSGICIHYNSNKDGHITCVRTMNSVKCRYVSCTTTTPLLLPTITQICRTFNKFR